MTRLVFTATATRDHSAILTTLAREAGWDVAQSYRAIFDRLFDRIEAHPRIGSIRPALGADIRLSVAAPFLVIYRHDAEQDDVTVLRILHGRQDVAARLSMP